VPTSSSLLASTTICVSASFLVPTPSVVFLPNLFCPPVDLNVAGFLFVFLRFRFSEPWSQCHTLLSFCKNPPARSTYSTTFTPPRPADPLTVFSDVLPFFYTFRDLTMAKVFLGFSFFPVSSHPLCLRRSLLSFPPLVLY